MKYYIDESGTKFRIDRETGEKVLVQTGPEAGEAVAPETTGNPTDIEE